MTEKITWNDPALVQPYDEQTVLIKTNGRGVLTAVYYERGDFNWLAVFELSKWRKDYSQPVDKDKIIAWAGYPQGPADISKLSLLDAAWAALEGVGFSRSYLTDSDVMRFLQEACNSEK